MKINLYIFLISRHIIFCGKLKSSNNKAPFRRSLSGSDRKIYVTDDKLIQIRTRIMEKIAFYPATLSHSLNLLEMYAQYTQKRPSSSFREDCVNISASGWRNLEIIPDMKNSKKYQSTPIVTSHLQRVGEKLRKSIKRFFAMEFRERMNDTR